MPSTVVVTLADAAYYARAKRTILDVRSRGEWTGDVVFITVGFEAPENFLEFYRVRGLRMEPVDTGPLLEQYRACPPGSTCDDRHYAKLTQWSKFYAFHPSFQQWERVVFLDAGLRVFDRIQLLAELPCEGAIAAPTDPGAFERILELDRNEAAVERLFAHYDRSILQAPYFLNCLWVYDTALLRGSSALFEELVQSMNDYPITRCNEMTIMNLVLTFKHGVWKPFPETTADGKLLFAWCNRDHGLRWRDVCFVKYPTGINFECE